MKVYVAGPMTGFPEWNFPAFADASERLREAGFEVTSPHEFDLDGGFDPSGSGAGFDLRRALERDVDAVLDADGVALLDGWEESPGTVVEVLTASSKGSPVFPVPEFIRRFGGVGLALVFAFVFGTALARGGVTPGADPIAQAADATIEAGGSLVSSLVDVVDVLTGGDAESAAPTTGLWHRSHTEVWAA